MFLLKLARILHIIDEKQFMKNRAIHLFKSSKLFNVKWYLTIYSDVNPQKISPEKHYYKYGWKKGYNPSPKFDGNAYLMKNPDVKKSGINPLEHYLISGRREGRHYTPVISKNQMWEEKSKWYLSLWERIYFILKYPVRVQEKCDRLKIKIKELKNTQRSRKI